MRSLITNGTVVTALGSYEADVLIESGTIAQIGRDLEAADAETIDASGKYVMPGAIDVHTHLDTPWGTGYTTVDDWRAGSVGAACGGTTAVVDFALQTPGQSLREAIDGWHAKAEGKSVIDYSFHAMVMDLNEQVLAEIPQMIDREGIPSFKVFMAYKGIVQADDETLLKTMITANDNGGLVMVHAENGDAIQVLQDRFAAAGDLGVEFWPKSRPPELEAEAAHRAIVLAGLVDAPLYIVHISSALTVEEVARGREQGVRVYGETCPQYLVLDESNYLRDDGAKWVMAPPLRDASNQEPLWRGLAVGNLHTVATDHSAWPLKDFKDQSLDDFRHMIQGAPGIEERPASVWTHGVEAGRISMNRFVDVVSTTPAKLFGMYPRKGDIAVGSDADIVVWDPTVSWTLGLDQIHGNTDYSTFEGLEVKGAPALVMSRGRVLVRDREYVGGDGGGEFVRRETFSAP
ncbi:MAG: dihydropyrimidinase [Gaiellaceae bacterium]